MGNHSFILIFVVICSLIVIFLTNLIDASYNHCPPLGIKLCLLCFILMGGFVLPALLAKFIQYIVDDWYNRKNK
ncbi:MAG: hypothetical protein LBP59_02635 [Planctomycetaceae bacterium]|nr:hypothetical protein [Planctomycetaceae bacterium]